MNVLTSQNGRKLAKEIKAVAYHECSALTGEGLAGLFSSAVRTAIRSPRAVDRWRSVRQCSIV